MPGTPDEATSVESTEVDDAFRALLEGLRTTLSGVQVLFAFLFILPFQASFPDLTDLERTAYYVAFFGTAVASVLLIAPSAHQRIRAPKTGVRRHSRSNLDYAVRMTVVGTFVFSVALVAGVYLVSSLVFSSAAATIPATVLGVGIAWAWFYVPLVTFDRS